MVLSMSSENSKNNSEKKKRNVKTIGIIAGVVVAGGIAAIFLAFLAAAPLSVAKDSTSTTTPQQPSELAFSSLPIWDEKATTTSANPINGTHTRIDFIGHGIMRYPDTGETINMTNTGYAIVTGKENIFAYGREYVTSPEDGDKTAITYYEILQYNTTSFHGKGLTIAVFDGNATGLLAPFNNMMAIGYHEDDPNDKEGATIKLWEWQGGINSRSNNLQ
jgi:hypothetical protein